MDPLLEKKKKKFSTHDSGKVIHYHLSFLSWGQKFSLGSSLIREENWGHIHGIKILRLSPPISHLLFADNLMIFSKTKNLEASSIKSCLDSYFSWSGQKVNFDKSAIFFSNNTRPSLQAFIYSSINLCQRTTKSRYLGIPLFLHWEKKVWFLKI
jgi:hypothetical protein